MSFASTQPAAYWYQRWLEDGNGTRVRRLETELRDASTALFEWRHRCEQLEDKFKHYHVGFGKDECQECGLDIRDPIHIRIEDESRD